MINLYGVFYDIIFPLLASDTAPQWVIIVIEIISMIMALIPLLIIAYIVLIPFKIIIKAVVIGSDSVSNSNGLDVGGGRKPRYRSKKWQKRGG